MIWWKQDKVFITCQSWKVTNLLHIPVQTYISLALQSTVRLLMLVIFGRPLPEIPPWQSSTPCFLPLYMYLGMQHWWQPPQCTTNCMSKALMTSLPSNIYIHTTVCLQIGMYSVYRSRVYISLVGDQHSIHEWQLDWERSKPCTLLLGCKVLSFNAFQS